MGNRKQPFGYCMEFGRIVEHPQEAETVRHIYAQYLAGATFKDLAEELSCQDVPYDTGKSWNKNMVARILEDSRYTGTKGFPQIIGGDTLNAALKLRAAKQVTIRQTPAQKVLRQLSGRNPTKKMETQALTILNHLIADPDLVQCQPLEQQPHIMELRQEMDNILTQCPIDEDRATALAFQCASMQYSRIGASEYETERIRSLLASAELMTELDADLLRESVSKIQMPRGKTVRLLLKNHQTIQGE